MKRRLAILLALTLTISPLSAVGANAAEIPAEGTTIAAEAEGFDADEVVEEAENPEDIEVAEEAQAEEEVISVTVDEEETVAEEPAGETEQAAEAVTEEAAAADTEAAAVEEPAAEAPEEIQTPETAEEAAIETVQEEEVVQEIADEAQETGEVTDGWNSARTKFFESGKAVTGWKTIDGAVYYFKSNGVMATGFKTIDGARYYFQNSKMKGYTEADKGKMATGFRTIGNDVYYFQNSAIKNFKQANLGKAIEKGWRTIGTKRYYFVDYKRQTGWVKVSGKYYYLKSNGAMATGIKTIDGAAYCFGTNGKMRTGWVKYNGLMAYYKSDGKAGKAGWRQKGDNWYYLKKNGVAKTGFTKLAADSIFYLDKAQAGAMLTGVHKLSNGKYYFFDEDGRRATTEGWKTFGEYSYYTYKNGTIARNVTISGIKIGSDGKVKGSLLDIKAAGYSSNTNYLILVNRGEHLVAVFKGKKNNWTKIKGDWLCTIGAPQTPTPEGVFKTYGPTGKTQYGWMDFQYTSAAFCTGVTAGFFFHTILYRKYWRGNPYSAPVEDGALGVNHSKSCVRLKTENAEWIRNNIPSGTTVVVYN